MKKSLLMKTMLLLCALMVGSMNGWAVDDPNWSYTVVNGDASKLNTTAKTFTVDATHVWSYEGTTVAAGTNPSITIGSYSSTYGIKFGESGSKYYKPVILSTSAFTDKAVTKVRLYLKHNGKKVGNLTVKQGSTTIGTATTANTSDWISVVCSETNKGAGGTLEIRYEVDQAVYIDKIEVWYEVLGTATTTTIDASGITNTDIYTSTAAGTLSASVTEKVGGVAVGDATVTWTSSNEDVAIVASDGTVTLKKKGSTTITASYTGDATYAASSAEYVLNVTSSAPQNTVIDVATNYEWLGVQSGKNIPAAELPKEYDCEGVTLTLGDGGTNKPRGDATYIRVYQDNSFTFEAPTNYKIKSIVFTAGTNWQKSFDADCGSYDSDSKTWTGLENSVTLTVESGSGNNYISNIQINLQANPVPVTITTAEYATFVSDKATDFSATGITVYTATDEETQVQLNEVTSGKIPANTPVVLYKAGADGSAINVPVIATADAPAGTNDLRVSTGTDVENMYVLSKKNDKVGFRVWNGSSDLSAGKVYLLGKASYGAREFIGFDDDVTAIEAVKTQNVENGQYFNLAGQRVAQPTKGLYIVNGKKVIIK